MTIGQAFVDQIVEDATQLVGIGFHPKWFFREARGNLGTRQSGRGRARGGILQKHADR